MSKATAKNSEAGKPKVEEISKIKKEIPSSEGENAADNSKEESDAPAPKVEEGPKGTPRFNKFNQN